MNYENNWENYFKVGDCESFEEKKRKYESRKEAYRLASEFLENSVVRANWRNPLELIKKMKWEVVPYHNSDINKASKEAYSTYKRGRYLIIYNIDNYITRIGYNIHHEVGHIVANHSLRFGEVLFKSSDNSESQILETEATIIGRNIFLPVEILHHLQISYSNTTILNYLVDTYNLSKEYVQSRIDISFEDYKNMKYDPKDFEEDVNFELENIYHFTKDRSHKKFHQHYKDLKAYNPYAKDTEENLLNKIMQLLKEKKKKNGI